MKKLIVASLAAAGLALTASVSLAQVVVGVSWNNFQEERWKTDEAAIKLIWLALRNITAEWVLPTRQWHAAMRQFAVLYEERFTVPRA